MDSPQLVGPVFNIFGSSTSRDIDFLVPNIPRPQDVTSIAQNYERQLKSTLSPDGSKELDCNLGVVEDGVLIWVYKGTPDISNNAIFDTYVLHKQFHPCIIKRRVSRNIPYLIIRTIRILVSKVTRTTIRTIARQALRSKPYEQLQFLIKLDFQNFSYNEKRTNSTDNYKSIAFQIGQLSALLQNKEIFTKEEIGLFNPKLIPFLSREKNYSLSDLTSALHDLMSSILTYSQIHPTLWATSVNGGEEPDE